MRCNTIRNRLAPADLGNVTLAAGNQQFKFNDNEQQPVCKNRSVKHSETNCLPYRSELVDSSPRFGVAQPLGNHR
jgi:hypothetical protein